MRNSLPTCSQVVKAHHSRLDIGRDRSNFMKLHFLLLAAALTSQRPWYRGGIAPIVTAAPLQRSCRLPSGGGPDDWQCDKGLRIVKLGTYKTWQCLVLEELKDDTWVTAKDNKPTCTDLQPKETK